MKHNIIVLHYSLLLKNVLIFFLTQLASFLLFPGYLGTAGRVCNKSSKDSDGCDAMCCGRGYDTMRIKRVTKCECKFKWCCAVECKDCEDMVDVHTCKPDKRRDRLDLT